MYIIPQRKIDGLDREQIENLLTTHSWQLIEQRVTDTLLRESAALEQPADEVTTADRRGYIRGLRMALQIPKILIGEGKPK
jgi:hypothetical protein